MSDLQTIEQKLDKIEGLLVQQNSPWLDFNSACKFLGIRKTKMKKLVDELGIKIYRFGSGGHPKFLKRDLNSKIIFPMKVRLSKAEKEFLASLE